ncbi:unnamed protein product [Thelazia callipaeda]|uniref:Uncharacterized protein n=1 Tax=Thelazia callipaeda TaxID=103827 RepID=A0A0N5CZY1_THECL|nr:unnamed protein product [Thelazia callipaeda]
MIKLGFETRNTFLSDQRIALDNLVDVTAKEEHVKQKSKREIMAHRTPLKNKNNFTDSDEYEDYIQSSSSDTEFEKTEVEVAPGACQQYFVVGSVIPSESILLMSKLIFKVPSFTSVSYRLIAFFIY